MFWLSTYLRMGTGVVEGELVGNWGEVQAGKLPATSSTDKIWNHNGDNRYLDIATLPHPTCVLSRTMHYGKNSHWTSLCIWLKTSHQKSQLFYWYWYWYNVLAFCCLGLVYSKSWKTNIENSWIYIGLCYDLVVSDGLVYSSIIYQTLKRIITEDIIAKSCKSF